MPAPLAYDPAMADDVSFQAEDLGTYTVLRASGFLDVSTSPRLRDALNEVPLGSNRHVLLDLGGIEFLDSSALGVILSAWKHMQSEGTALAVVSPHEHITKIFEITALTLSIDVYPSVGEARERLGLPS
jgi:anti-sigma B factor antagonist